MRILVICYSQSGDVAKITEVFCHSLKTLPGLEVVEERLRPAQDYPFPWKSLGGLFHIFPECQLGLGPGIKPLSVSAKERFDLVVLSFQVWHLAPSLPIQDLFKSEYSSLLRRTPVITICVSRNMWHSASEKMKLLLRNAEALHLDNVVVTHEGPPMATFVSVPRLLLFGKRDRLWGIFPAAEISDAELTRVRLLGASLADQVGRLAERPGQAILSGKGAVRVNRRYILAEWIGARLYYALANLAIICERLGFWARRAIIYTCIPLLLLGIIVLIPFTMLLTAIVYPLVGSALENYSRRLAEPSGEDTKACLHKSR